MTAKTMLDLGGLAVLEGDPLGLRELEEFLAWQANGPLPDWLDGAEPNEDDDELFTPPAANVAPATKSTLELADVCPKSRDFTVADFPSVPAPLPIVEPLPAAPPPSERDEVHAPNKGNVGVASRRQLSTDEWNGARLCLLTSVAGQMWAVPLENVAQVARHAATNAFDLYERLEGKTRREPGMAVVFENDSALIVDYIIGPRSLDWAPLPAGCEEPIWVLARAELAGQTAGLLDWQALITS